MDHRILVELDNGADPYPVPEVEAETLGVSLGNPDLNMPPFAVDAGPGQGNGDISDAAIFVRGRIAGDPTGSFYEVSFPFVGVTEGEAGIVVTALEALAARPHLLEVVRDLCWDDDAEGMATQVLRLAERFRFVSDPRATER